MSSSIRWSGKALTDLVRLHAFLAPVNPLAAARTVQALARGVRVLSSNPRLGTSVSGFEPREVRRLIVGDHEVRYVVQGDTVTIVRLWHTRENR